MRSYTFEQLQQAAIHIAANTTGNLRFGNEADEKTGRFPSKEEMDKSAKVWIAQSWVLAKNLLDAGDDIAKTFEGKSARLPTDEPIKRKRKIG